MDNLEEKGSKNIMKQGIVLFSLLCNCSILLWIKAWKIMECSNDESNESVFYLPIPFDGQCQQLFAYLLYQWIVKK